MGALSSCIGAAWDQSPPLQLGRKGDWIMMHAACMLPWLRRETCHLCSDLIAWNVAHPSRKGTGKCVRIHGILAFGDCCSLCLIRRPVRAIAVQEGQCGLGLSGGSERGGNWVAWMYFEGRPSEIRGCQGWFLNFSPFPPACVLY